MSHIKNKLTTSCLARPHQTTYYTFFWTMSHGGFSTLWSMDNIHFPTITLHLYLPKNCLLLEGYCTKCLDLSHLQAEHLLNDINPVIKEVLLARREHLLFLKLRNCNLYKKERLHMSVELVEQNFDHWMPTKMHACAQIVLPLVRLLGLECVSFALLLVVICLVFIICSNERLFSQAPLIISNFCTAVSMILSYSTIIVVVLYSWGTNRVVLASTSTIVV